VNTNQIIRALRDWSPFGLCDGTLIKQNGKREKTVGCAQGALAMSFVHSPTGRAWLRKKGHKVKGFRLHDFVGGQSLGTGEFAQAVAKHFGTTTVVLSTIMHFNDSINTGSRRAGPDHGQYAALPYRLREAIVSLRKRFDKKPTACYVG
jgi:hypothetical protein